MDKFFFSEKNVNRQCTTLEKLINIKNNPESKRNCKKFLVQQMKEIYSKYGKKKSNNMKVSEFIDLLNKKSIKECIRICEEKKKNKQSRNFAKQDELGEYERARDKEIYGNRTQPILQDRPQFTDLKKRNKDNGNIYDSNDNRDLGFAPIPKGNGEFITANGEMGDKMFFGNLEADIYDKKSDSKDDLERKMMDRMNQYDNKGLMSPMSYMNQNIFGQDKINQMNPMNMNSMNMNSMNMNMNMNPMNMNLMRMNNQEFNNNNNNPQQLNFTLVEGRNKKNANNSDMLYQNDIYMPLQYDKNLNITDNEEYGNLQGKLNTMMSERDMPDYIKKDKVFNPMISPNIVSSDRSNNNMNNMDINQILMMQKMHDMNNNNNNNNNLNYRIGQETVDIEGMVNLDSEQLDTYIRKIKDKIYHQMNLTNFDPFFLQSLDSKKLDELIKKISIELSGLNNLFSTETDNFNDKNKIENKIVTNDIDVTNNISNNISNKMITYSDILIKSEEYDEPSNYNDYLVKFKEPYKNVINFKIINIKINNWFPKILSNSGHFTYIINGDEKIINIQIDDHNNLITAISQELPKTFEIIINKTGKVTIKNTELFIIKNDDTNVFRQLGFTKTNYSGRKMYTGEILPLVNKNTKIYLYIEGIDDKNPLAIFDASDDIQKICPIIVNFEYPIKYLSEIFIKFKTDQNIDSNSYVDFNGASNEILIRIGTII